MPAVQISEPMLKRTRERKRGHPSAMLSFRCPKELVEVVQGAGRDKTEGAVRLLDVSNDAMTELGDLWAEVEIRAYREQITEGQALAQLAREAIEREKKSRK